MLSISSVVDFQGCALNQTCFTGGYPVNHSTAGGCVFTYAIKKSAYYILCKNHCIYAVHGSLIHLFNTVWFFLRHHCLKFFCTIKQFCLIVYSVATMRSVSESEVKPV